jgi:hypothetical protein
MKASRRGLFVSRKSLYRRLGCGVIGILMGFVFSATPGEAQMPQLKRPEEAPQEKPPETKPKKLVNEPRAVGLLQLNNSGKGTLIPVAIRIDGKFYDASVYKADPVPMALDVGTVYEVEKDGASQGLFTVSGALHNKNPNSPTQWLGAGSYVVNGSEPAKTIFKAEDKPRGLEDSNDAPPKLKRGKEDSTDTGSARGSGGSGTNPSGAANGDGAAKDAGSAKGGTGTATAGDSGKGGSGPATTAAQGSPSGSGSQGSGSQGSGSGSAAAGSTSASQGSATQSAAAKGASDQSSASQSSAGQGQVGQNYYRPMLRRGKPTESAPEDTPEELTRTTETPAPNATAGMNPANATKPQVQVVPAISDAGGPRAETYQFFWKESEEDDRRKQMLGLAADEIRAYLTRLAKDTIPAKPAAAKASATRQHASVRRAETKVEPVFENIQFRAFDVWRTNQPVMILTAEAHLPQKAGADAVPMVYDITIAARTDIYGDLRKLFAAVTDKFHLDVTPRLELIDAVDADGDGHGELLFRETADAGTGYIIYRPTGDTLWKMFDSLNPE